MWDVKENNFPNHIINYLNINKKTKSFRTITVTNKHVPLYRTKYKSYFLSTMGVTLWRDLPCHIKETATRKLYPRKPVKNIFHSFSHSFNNLFIISARTTHYRLKLLKVSGPKIWNLIPNHIRSTQSVYSFKRIVKKHDSSICLLNAVILFIIIIIVVLLLIITNYYYYYEYYYIIFFLNISP